MKFPAAIFIIIVMTIAIDGRTILSGDISKFLLDSSNSPFIVTEDINVPENRRVVIHEGCVFLFKAFTGMNVLGRLVVEGTPEKPVIFTSINDERYGQKHDSAAAPFDWNGIYIHPAADSVAMSNFILCFSVYGINALNRTVAIVNGIFSDNGQYHCAVEGRQQNVEDNVPFSFSGGTIPRQVDTVAYNREDPPDGNATTQSTIAPPPASNRTITLTSFPPKVEVYINKQPGIHTWKNGLTPFSLSADKKSATLVTLFKSGYDNMTFQIDFTRRTDSMHVVLLPLPPEKVVVQHRFLNDRLQAKIGFWFLAATPFLMGAGALSTWYALEQREKADAATDFLGRTLLSQSDPEYQRYQGKYDRAKERTDRGRTGAITAFGTGVALLGVGIILYW